MTITEILKAEGKPFGVEPDERLCGMLETYAALLLEWNRKINLTRITDDAGIAVKHFLDSLLLQKCADIPAGSRLLDVGTGAGLPGLVLAAARPDIRVTLLDSTGKKLTAVGEMAKGMGVTNCTLLHARAEEAGREPAHREQYDFVCARAVASLPVLLEYCLPFVKPGGSFLAMKAAQTEEEIALCKEALRLLSGEIAAVRRFSLPEANERTVICVRKISPVSSKYPRVSAQIAKKPL